MSAPGARRHNALLEGPILKSLLTLAVPVVLANILQSAYALIDAFWVGRLGGAAVAAVSLSFPVMFLMIALGMGLAMAGSTLTAQYRGAGNDSMVSHVAAQTLNMVVVLSITLSILGYIFTPALLHLMGVAPDVYAGALGFMVMTFLIASFGTQTLAAYGVGSNIMQVVIIPAFGLSMAISALAGQNIGAGNIERAARIGKLGALLGFCTLTVLGIIVFLFAPQIAAFFVPSDQGVIAAAAHFMRIMSLAWGFLGFQLALTGVLRASGNMVTTMMITLASTWVIQFPLAYVLSTHTSLGSSGIWWAFPVNNVVTALIAVSVYARGTWKKTRLISRDDKVAARIEREAELEEPMR